MKHSTRDLLVWTGVLGALALFSVVFMVLLDNAYEIDGSYADFNSTPQDAIEEGTFIQYVTIAPDTLRTAGGRVRFGRAWIHEDSHLRIRWLVQRTLVRDGTYRMCFNLAEGGPPAPGIGPDSPLLSPRQWMVDVESGIRYDASLWFGHPWRFCRPVTRPFPARASIALVREDSIRAGMQRFAGTVHPPAQPATRPRTEARVQAGGRTLLLSHVEWNGFAMLWISERDAEAGSAERWRVVRVMDLPEAPLNYQLRFGPCGREGEPRQGTLILDGLHGIRNINSAWRVDGASAELVPVPVQGLRCEGTRPF